MFELHSEAPPKPWHSRKSPGDWPRPPWLKEGNYGDTTWVVVDDLPSSPKRAEIIRWDVQLFDPRRRGQLCRLTDPEYSHLLDTAKRQSFGLRIGRYATVSTAKTHEEMTRKIVNMILWMVQNSILRFSDLDKDDFDAYVEAARFGTGYLLGYATRLIEFVDNVKVEEREIPVIKRSNTRPFLDAVRLLEAAGIDPMRGRTDTATCFELLKIAENANLYLAPRQRKRLAEGPPLNKKLVVVPLLRMLQPWDYNWRMRDSFPGDRIQFQPFENISALQMAQELGERQGRTRTAPVRQTMELIDQSIRWVLDYAPVLLELRDKHFDLIRQDLSKDNRYDRLNAIISSTLIPSGPGTPLPLDASTKKTSAEALNFGTAVNHLLPATCAVVISAFSGRRHEEVLTVRAAGPRNDHCISKNAEGYWIETFIEKSCQEWVKTPCNEIVAAAVTILDRWSAPARAISETPGLFQIKRLVDQRVATFYFGKALKDLVNFLDLAPLRDGTQWEFSPHQFRRFFAILYFWGYRYRNLAALSYHFRHLNPAMTQVYVTEPETGAIFSEVNKQHTTTLLSETAVGELNLSGPFGERFKNIAKKLYRHYRRSTKVVASSLVEKVVERYVNRSGRRLKIMEWGFCCVLATPGELDKANCLKNDISRNPTGPDFANSSPTTCCTCPYHATEEIFEPFLRSQLEAHERAAADPTNGPILRAASRERAEQLRMHCQRAFENSKRVEDFSG